MRTYKESKLGNGLKIISSYIPQTEAVNISIWFKAGSRYEKEDEKGYAHLFEHLIFSGNSKYKNNFEIASVVERRGGYINGWTSRSYIYFEIKVAAKYAEEMFQLLSDMVTHPLLRAEDLKKDREIVIREIHRNKDSPARWSGKLAYAKVFEGHPLANDPLGSEKSVLEADINRLKSYYTRFFTPERAAIITAGGLKHQIVEELTEKYFASWRSSVSIEETQEAVPLPKSSNHFFEKRGTQETYLHFNYLTSGVKFEEENAALDILSDYLGLGMSGLLSRELREKKKLVYSVFTHATKYLDAGVFNINTSTKDPEKVIETVLSIINELEKDFNKKAVETMKIKTINNYKLINSVNPISTRPLGEGFVLHNRMYTTDEHISLLEKVTIDRLTEVTRKYLTSKNLFLVALGPRDIDVSFAKDEIHR